jgi:NAD(P)-dependent dehydrogenase (short-subunit alcohol dehydrogenase family)
MGLEGTGIRINVLSPGPTATRGLLNGLARTGTRLRTRAPESLLHGDQIAEALTVL